MIIYTYGTLPQQENKKNSGKIMTLEPEGYTKVIIQKLVHYASRIFYSSQNIISLSRMGNWQRLMSTCNGEWREGNRLVKYFK